jgi:hypothetical protein
MRCLGRSTSEPLEVDLFMLQTAAPSHPSRPSRPRRRASLLVAALAALALLATACHEDNTPQHYDSVTKDNFVQGCTGGGTGTTLASDSLCTCLYNVTTASIPASASDKKTRGGSKTFATYNGKTFIQINDELKNDPNSLPSSLTDAFKENCPGFQGATTTTAKPSSNGGPTTVKPKS